MFEKIYCYRQKFINILLKNIKNQKKQLILLLLHI
jgi:hypothetical protein